MVNYTVRYTYQNGVQDAMVITDCDTVQDAILAVTLYTTGIGSFKINGVVEETNADKECLHLPAIKENNQ